MPKPFNDRERSRREIHYYRKIHKEGRRLYRQRELLTDSESIKAWESKVIEIGHRKYPKLYHYTAFFQIAGIQLNFKN